MTQFKLQLISYLSILCVIGNALSYVHCLANTNQLSKALLTEKGGSVSLSVLSWKYTSNDNASFSSQVIDEKTWTTLMRQSSHIQPYGVWSGIGWFRVIFMIDSSLVNVPLELSVQQLGASEIFLNGKLMRCNGVVSQNSSLERSNDKNATPITFVFSQTGQQTLAIRYSCASLGETGGSHYPQWLQYWLREQMRVPIIVAGELEHKIGIRVALHQVTNEQKSLSQNVIQSLSKGAMLLYTAFGILAFTLFIYYRLLPVNLAFAVHSVAVVVLLIVFIARFEGYNDVILFISTRYLFWGAVPFVQLSIVYYQILTLKKHKKPLFFFTVGVWLIFWVLMVVAPMINVEQLLYPVIIVCTQLLYIDNIYSAYHLGKSEWKILLFMGAGQSLFFVRDSLALIGIFDVHKYFEIMGVTLNLVTITSFILDLARQNTQAYRSVQAELKRSKELSQKILEKEYEKQRIIAEQNEMLEQEVLTRTKSFQEVNLQLFNANTEIQRQIAIQVEQSKKIEQSNVQLQQSHDNLILLSEIGKGIVSLLDLQAIGKHIYGSVNSLLDAPVLIVCVNDTEKFELRFEVLIEDGEIFEPFSVSLTREELPAVQCVSFQKEVLLQNEDIPVLVGAQVSSLVYLPLVADEYVIGAFSVQSFKKNAFSAYDINILRTISPYIAAALKNAKSYQEVQYALETLRRTQTQLAQAEKMASLGTLVAGVAHELNTPIGVAVTAASTLKSRTDIFTQRYAEGGLKKSELEAYIETAKTGADLTLRNLERAADLIQSFKQVAVDQTSDNKRRFKLRSYLEGVITSLEPKWKAARHQVEIECDESIELETYPGAVAQIITNLIENSLLHGFQGFTEEGLMRIVAEKKGERITLTYSDNGRGIPPEVLPRIFDPFFTTKQAQGGTGLGMHIVFNLVTQKLGGEIVAEKTDEIGARFIIHLPTEV